MHALTFKANNQGYCCELEAVVRVIKVAALVQLPNMADWMKGVLDYAGERVAVIDLMQRMDPAYIAHYTVDTPIIIIKHAGVMIGLLVDGVEQVIDFENCQINSIAEFSNIDSIKTTAVMKDCEYLKIEAEQLVTDLMRVILNETS